MNRLLQACLLTLTLTVLGCAEPGHYPLTGEDCGPNDPVRSLDTGDCTAPVG